MASVSSLATGFPALDAALGGGWFTGMLTELLVPGHGSGELGLLSPALAQLTTAGRWVALIAPPWIPYAPGLFWQGLALDHVLMIGVRQPQDVLWAMEEALKSGSCAGVIAWAGSRMEYSRLQRLHLLAGKYTAWLVLVRAVCFRHERSPARLRMQLKRSSPAILRLDIFKSRWRATGAVTVDCRF